MSIPSRYEWSEITIVAVFAGGIASGLAMLQRFGFDKSATFTFFGAIVGAAAVVLLSTGQQERLFQKAKNREFQQIRTYFSAVATQLDDYFGSPFKVDVQGRLDPGGCIAAISTVQNLRNYAVQAARHAVYLGFAARANLEALVEQCDHTLAVLQRLKAELDKLSGSPDYEEVKRTIVNLHNTMQLPINL